MRIERAAIVAVMLGGAVSIAGCPGLLENKLAFVETEAGTCGDVPTTIFATTCTGSGCHSAVNPAGQLDLQSPNVAARLVDKPAHNDCVGTLADPSAPKNSILYQKLTTAPPCGSRMPLGATPLTDAEIACVATWIGDQQIPGAGGSGGSGGKGGNGGSGGATGGAGGSGGATGGGGTGASGGASGGGGAGGTAGSGGAAGGSSVSASSASTGTG